MENKIISFDDLFKKEIRQDTIMLLIKDMNKLSDEQEYEKAKEILDNIKIELEKPASDIWPYSYVPIGDIQTIKDIYDLIISTPIRLHPDNYKFSDFLNLIIAVHNRKDELKGIKYSDTERHRKIVAEEMVRLKIVIPAKQKRKGTAPNRRFLEIVHTINPDICLKELRRRENVKLWKAVESGNKEKIEGSKENARKYLDRERIY